MSTWVRTWQVALRIARRDARRARGRSALVVAMIALPVLGVSAVDVLARTVELSPEQQATRELGQADAAFLDSGQVSIRQRDAVSFEGGDRPRDPATPFDLRSALSAGSRSLLDRTHEDSVTVGDVTVSTSLRGLSYDDPLAAGLYQPVEGAPPASADEVTLTQALAERLGVGVGGRVRLRDLDRDVTVVGIVSSGNRAERTVLLEPDALPENDIGARTFGSDRLLVDVPDGLTWSHVQAANAIGVYVQPRGEVPGAPPISDAGTNDGRRLAAVALVIGMALLEVVLLAGPAFAVGAKRQRRQLALLAATGAERRDVRRTVLSGGLVLGVVGGIIGVAGGIALAAAALPLLTRFSDTAPGPFDVRPLELAGIALVGVGTAVLAALLPARAAARQDVVAALTGRRGTVRSSRRLPIIGLLAAMAGAAVALYGAQQRDVLTILAGSVVAELGLVATTPFLVGVTGRLAPLLPVAPRLALRDAARNRARTAPAVAAMLAAVAGSVAVGTYVASLDGYDRLRYQPSAVEGTAVFAAYEAEQRERLPAVAAALRDTLPTRDVLTVSAIDAFDTAAGGLVELVVPAARQCPLNALTSGPTEAQKQAALRDPRCNGLSGRGLRLPALHLVGGAALLAAVTGVDDPAAQRVLAEGGVVVPNANLVDEDGTVTVVSHPADDPDGTQGRRIVLPGIALLGASIEATIFSPEAAQKIGRGASEVGLVAVLDRVPTEGEQDRAQGALARLGIVDDQLYVERGYNSDYGLGLLALVLGSAVVVLGASGIATGLAAADGRADLATLAAIGATPSLRRTLAAFQSAVTAGLGTALGVLAGLVPAIGLLTALNSTQGRPVGFAQEFRYPLIIPWEHLAVTAVVVPLVAALAAAALTRSRLPLVQRLA